MDHRRVLFHLLERHPSIASGVPDELITPASSSEVNEVVHFNDPVEVCSLPRTPPAKQKIDLDVPCHHSPTLLDKIITGRVILNQDAWTSGRPLDEVLVDLSNEEVAVEISKNNVTGPKHEQPEREPLQPAASSMLSEPLQPAASPILSEPLQPLPVPMLSKPSSSSQDKSKSMIQSRLDACFPKLVKNTRSDYYFIEQLVNTQVNATLPSLKEMEVFSDTK